MSREADFDESADMRLVELQRAALGVAPQKRNWESRVQTEGSAVEAELVQESASAVLDTDLVASPGEGVIAGAVITLTLSIANDGVLAAHNLLVAVPVPGDATFRSGSMVHDGRAEDDRFAEQFLGEGLRIAQLLPKNRTTFVWKIGVRAGASPLTVSPTIRADGAAIVGGAAVLITRKSATQTAFATQLAREIPPEPVDAQDRPFYELDQEEELEHLAAGSALSLILEQTMAEEPPIVETEEPEEPEQPIAPAREGIALTGAFDRPSLAYFERIFNASKQPTLLNHFIFAGALACNRWYASGEEVGGLKRHMDAQSQLLHRITLHEKLGRKEPIVEYAGTLEFDNTVLVAQPIPERPAMLSSAERLILETQIDEPSLAQIQKLSADPKRWDFIAARQVTLLLQGRRVIAESQADAAAAVSQALTAYADTARVLLNRLFVRIRLDRTTGALYQTEPSLDEAAKAALVAMRRLFDALS